MVKALESGITTFDQADPWVGYRFESLFDKALAESRDLRDQMRSSPNGETTHSGKFSRKSGDCITTRLLRKFKAACSRLAWSFSIAK